MPCSNPPSVEWGFFIYQGSTNFELQPFSIVPNDAGLIIGSIL